MVEISVHLQYLTATQDVGLQGNAGANTRTPVAQRTLQGKLAFNGVECSSLSLCVFTPRPRLNAVVDLGSAVSVLRYFSLIFLLWLCMTYF